MINTKKHIIIPITRDLIININCLYLVVTIFLLYRLLKKKTTTMINVNMM